jgi:cell division GTPase FtsZ
VIDEAMGDVVRVTVIATGFGPQRQRRRREVVEGTAPQLAPQRRERSREGFEVPDELLDVPSFLRDN